MADKCDVSKIVTTFLLNTCRLPPRLSKVDVEATMCCLRIATDPRSHGEYGEIIPLVTGSVAEFCIEPMLPHVGDIDAMHYSNSWLAIPRGHPPPTQLPAGFHNNVTVFEIINSHLPGYVYLLKRYFLTLCTNDDKYEYVEYEEELYLSSDNDTSGGRHIKHGPAVFTDWSHIGRLSIDSVVCVRCLSWPPQAADWPTRHRKYGWPDSATVDRVVRKGCDAVGVAHHQCRQHEWMRELQHRLSFSRSEMVLINSWIPVQQIVYHMLRYFIKTERLTECDDDSGAGTLSNYHVKTLMLWACELKSRSWWTENLNLVKICVELLQTLSAWLTDTRCPHYFINNCNLLDKSFNVGSVANKLLSIDEEYLSNWFVNNYIGQCARVCPVAVSWLFNDVSTIMKLQNAVSEIVHWRLNASLYEKWQAVGFAEVAIAAYVSHSRNPVTVRSCVCWINGLAKIDQRFSIYFSAVQLLNLVHNISGNCFNNELLDILAILLGSNVFSLHKTEMSTSELVKLVCG